MRLETRYLGLTLEHPLVPSASPLSRDLDGIRRLEDAGAPAVVLHSLFEEQIEAESRALHHYLDYGTESHAEALTYFPEPEAFTVGPDAYLDLVRAASEALDIPVIGSLNGYTPGGWTRYARMIEEAGPAALELNLYHLPTDPDTTGEEVERRYLRVVSDVREQLSIPLAVKLSPYLSATANVASRMARAGADALVLFNRFYQPDFDLDELEVKPHLELSRSGELTLPLRWVAILFGRIPADLAITGGVHTHLDALKGLMAGARVAMLASELLACGLGRIGEIRAALADWMEEREYDSVQQLQGSMSQLHVAGPAAFERANYMKTLQSWREDPAAMGH